MKADVLEMISAHGLLPAEGDLIVQPELSGSSPGRWWWKKEMGYLNDTGQNRGTRGCNLCQEEMRFSESLWPGVDTGCLEHGEEPLGRFC